MPLHMLNIVLLILLGLNTHYLNLKDAKTYIVQKGGGDKAAVAKPVAKTTHYWLRLVTPIFGGEINPLLAFISTL